MKDLIQTVLSKMSLLFKIDFSEPKTLKVMSGLGAGASFYMAFSEGQKQNPNYTTIFMNATAGFGCLEFYNSLDSCEEEREYKRFEHEKAIACIQHTRSKVNNVLNEEIASAPFEVYKLSDALGSSNDFRPMLGMLMPENCDSLIYGTKGTMKSILVLGTMIQIVLGQYPEILPPEDKNYERPQNVHAIYVDGENGKAVLNDRYKSFGTRLDNTLEIVETKSYGNDMNKLFEKLTERCMLQPSGTRILLGIDNIKSLLNDHSNKEGKKYLNKLKELRALLSKKNISLSTITICHTVKDGKKISGTYDLPCLIPFVFKIEPSHTFTIEESRTGPKGVQFELVVKEDGYTRLAYKNIPLGEPVYKGRLTLEKAREMKNFYQENVSGRGLRPTAEKYGLEQHTHVKEELKALEEYESAMTIYNGGA